MVPQISCLFVVLPLSVFEEFNQSFSIDVLDFFWFRWRHIYKPCRNIMCETYDITKVSMAMSTWTRGHIHRRFSFSARPLDKLCSTPEKLNFSVALNSFENCVTRTKSRLFVVCHFLEEFHLSKCFKVLLYLQSHKLRFLRNTVCILHYFYSLFSTNNLVHPIIYDHPHHSFRTDRIYSWHILELPWLCVYAQMCKSKDIFQQAW